MIKSLFQNTKNPHKYIYVAKYDCGHFYVFQFMAYGNGVENRYCSGARWRKNNLCELLSDYNQLWEI